MPKISALTSLAQADVVTTTDVLPIVDATAPATTKKVTVQAMVNAGLATLTTLPSGIVNASLNSITPTGGTLSISGAIQLPSLNTWALTSFGDGNFYISRPGVENYVVVSPTGLAVTGSISATNSTGRIDANDSQAAGVGVGGSLFLRGKDTNGDYQDFAGINAFLTNGPVGNVSADLIFKTRLSGTLAERMRLLSYGDLLINQTTNPSSYKLAVTGNVGVTGAINATGTIASSNALETLNSGSLYQYNAGSTTFFRSRNDGNNLDVSYNGGGVITRTNTSGFAVTGLTTTDTLRVNVTPTAETPTATHTAVFNINGTNYKFLCLAA